MADLEDNYPEEIEPNSPLVVAYCHFLGSLLYFLFDHLIS